MLSYQLLSPRKESKFHMALLLWCPGHSGNRSVWCSLTYRAWGRLDPFSTDVMVSQG